MNYTEREFDLALEPIRTKLRNAEHTLALDLDLDRPLVPSDPGYYGLQETYRTEYHALRTRFDRVGEDGEVVLDKVNEMGERVCRVDGCGRVLVKNPGRGRPRKECRDGEGCKE